MQLVPRCISTIAMQLRPSFVIEERFHSFRRRRVEKEDLSQETLPTGVVRKIVIGVLLPFAYYLHTPWSNQFLGHENGKQLQVTTIKQILPQTWFVWLNSPVGTAAPPNPPPQPRLPLYLRLWLWLEHFCISTVDCRDPLPMILQDWLEEYLQVTCRLQVSTNHDILQHWLQHFCKLSVAFRYPLPMIPQHSLQHFCKLTVASGIHGHYPWY